MTYIGKHADLTPAALATCRARDLNNSLTWPCTHYRPKHSAFVPKVRVVRVTVLP